LIAIVPLQSPENEDVYSPENFSVTDGIKVKLEQSITEYNFGVTVILNAGESTKQVNEIVHPGWAYYWKLQLP
jgi:hypothetical protein